MIGVIGAGLAGLTAGKVLSDREVSYTLIEASDCVGGRVKSDYIDGHICDHGFQVLLDSYPQVEKHLDLKALSLKKFNAGANIVLEQGKVVTVADPLRNPEKLIETLLSPIGTLADKMKILKLKSPFDFPEDKKTSELLKEMGFSDKMIQSFFRPFFSGVFLEKELETPADYFQFIYQRFSKGYATLPEKGMKEIAFQLKSKNKGKIVLSSPVSKIMFDDKVTVYTENTNYEFDKLILAVDNKSCKKLIPDLEINTETRGCVTYYFSASKTNEKKYLYLNGMNNGKVNHIACLTAVQESYSDKELYSVTTLGDDDLSQQEVLNEVKNWNVFDTSSWQFIRKYSVPYALPKSFYNDHLNSPYEKLIIAGDFSQNPSIEGAMLSGEKAAIKI